MAGKIKRMSQIKQLLKLYQQSVPIKRISRQVGMSKNTVKEYLKKLDAISEPIDYLLKQEDPVLERILFSGSPSYKDTRYDDLKKSLKYLEKELQRTGVTRYLLWEEYKASRTLYYSYSQFCYHLQQHLSCTNPSMVLHHKPGEKLFVDFAGKKLSYIDIKTGEVVECEVFVACLPYSDYGFAIAVNSQKVADFIHSINQCLQYFRGVPKTIVTDNLKSAVIKADKYEPKINQALEDLANHYGTTITPTRSYKPKDKALVENHVKLIYTRVFAKLRNNTFYDLASLNQAIKDCLKSHNQTRMQHKDYCREEKFISEESNYLSALPSDIFELKHYKEYKVAGNGHIMLYQDKNYYSVPFQYIGQYVNVIYTRNIVSIYHKGSKIAMHVRNYQKGHYSSKADHLCSEHQHYLKLSPEYYLTQAGVISEKLKVVINHLFNKANYKYPEQMYRTCDGLLSLGRKTKDKQFFNKACQIAIDNEVYSYKFIKNLLSNNVLDNESEKTHKSLPEHLNTRGPKYYV